MADPDPLRGRIVDAALAAAEEAGGWRDLRPHLVARRVGVPLSAVLDRFRDADAIADAWFARALRAMVGGVLLQRSPWVAHGGGRSRIRRRLGTARR